MFTIVEKDVTEYGKPISPDLFATFMRDCASGSCIKDSHVKADEIMCELLTRLGYWEGVAIFQDMDKWYA